MPTSVPAAPALSRRHSLRWRLPLFVCAIVLAVAMVFLSAAYYQVERTLLLAASLRAQTLADQIVLLLGPSAQQRFNIDRAAAANPVVVAFVEKGEGEASEVETHLRSLLGAGQQLVELWGSGGQRLVAWSTVPGAQPSTSAPSNAGLTVVQRDGRLGSQMIVEIGASADPPRPPNVPAKGYLVVGRPIALTPPDILNRMVGNGAVLMGPRTGGQWTNFATLVPPPAVDLSQARGMGEYRAADGTRRIGGLSALPGTLALWVEFPRNVVLEPAAVFLARMMSIALVILAVAAAVTWWITGRITKPLSQMASVADAIADGDLSQRVDVRGGSEIGRLGQAFDQMVDRVKDGNQRLETEIKERTDAIDALRESEALHRAIVDVAFDSIITIDPAGTIIEFNSAAERTFGYPRADALGRELAELIVPPSLREAHRRGLARFVATGRAHLMGQLLEMTALRADGTEFPVELAITAIQSDGPLRLTGVVRDITTRKNAAQALVESERAYRSTFDEAPIGIAHMAIDGPFLRVNARLCTLLGYTAEELVGLDPFALKEGDRVPERQEARALLLSGASSRHVGEVRYRTREGKYLMTQVMLSLHRDEVGTPLYFIAIIEDVSERRKLEAQLRQSQKMEAVGRLAGGVAHDFNNLLTAILGFSALTLEKLSPEDPVRAHLLEIQHAGESAASLTRQLLAFSRRQILHLEVLDLNAVVSRMDGLLRRLIGEDIQLEHRLEPSLPRISADAGQVEQVIMNLALNARDAMPWGGRLTIETMNLTMDEQQIGDRPMQSPGPYVMLAVSDTGVGMSAATQAQIFEPFFTTKEHGEGTGLGLATVYGIVKQSGGWIWVYSELGKGATFKLYFPLTPETTDAQQAAHPPKSLRGHETILLTEDQPEVRAVVVAVLKRAGYNVLQAAGGPEALKIARATSGPIHLLLTDVVMPSMSGPELAKLFHADRPGTRVLYASGYTDDAVVRHGVLHDDVAFLQKPFTPQGLLQKVREVLDAGDADAGGGVPPPPGPS